MQVNFEETGATDVESPYSVLRDLIASPIFGFLQSGRLMLHQLFRRASLGHAHSRNCVALAAMLFDAGVPVAGTVVSDGAANNMSAEDGCL